MILQTLENNSIVVMGNLVGEYDVIVAFRQFRIGELVKHGDSIWQITDVDTYTNAIDHTTNNYYTVVMEDNPTIRGTVAEIDLLRDNPRTTPSNIIDAIAPALPIPHFVGGSWNQGKVLSQYYKNML